MSGAETTCVVVAFHRPDDLRDLLAALGPGAVVVNVEDDAQVHAVAAHGGARIVTLPANPGYAAAVNAGVRAAGGDVIVFMNDDVHIERDTVCRLAQLVCDGDADVAAPRLVRADGVVESTIAALPSPLTLAFEWMALPDAPVPGLRRFVHPQKWREPTQREQIRSCAATVLACRRSLLEELPLPEDYFLYWEEAEWFYRAAARGCRVVYDPNLVARHVGGRSDVRPEKSRLMARNAIRCVRRTQGRSAALLAWLVVIAWNLRLTATAGWRREPGLVRARWAGLAAAVAGVKEIR